MKTFHRFTMTATLLASLLGGCAGEYADPVPLPERLAALDLDLSVGSTGDQVRTLNEYLSIRGYYPNEQLAAEYPAWRPVAAAPADAGLFDANTVAAVRRFQANSGLEATGIVDARTRGALRGINCGVPDNIQRPDEGDKYSILTSTVLNRGEITWKLSNTLNLSRSDTEAGIANGLAIWRQMASGITFRRVDPSASANLVFQFGALSNANWTGQANGRTVTFNNTKTWSINGTATDVASCVAHEGGHAIGFNHSAWNGALMFHFYPGLTFTLDDSFAASALYDNFGIIAGPGGIGVKDVGVAFNTNEIWAIGGSAMSAGNFQIWKRNPNGTWTKTPEASEAMRIAVEANGVPWVVQSNGSIWRRSSASTGVAATWTQQPGSATDIGIGANGDVWIADTANVNGGHRICKFVGGSPVCSNGGGIRVSVTQSGIPWIVAASGAVFRHSNNQPTSGTWEQLSGSLNDIAVGPEHVALPGTSITIPIPYAWSVARKSNGMLNLSAWAEQPAVSTGDGSGSESPYAKGWLGGVELTVSGGNGGAAASVAMGSDGQPVIVDTFGDIFKSAF